MNTKLGVDQFEAKIKSYSMSSVVTQIQMQVGMWNTQFKFALVVMNEMMKLYQLRTDETAQQKENKLTILIAQMTKLINSSETGVLGTDPLGVAVDTVEIQNHNQLPMSPRHKKTILRSQSANKQYSKLKM